MQPVTARFLANLPLARWAPTAEWSYDGGATWEPVTLHAGEVTASATQQWRWSASVTISGLDTDRPGFTPHGSRLRLSQTLVYGPGDSETVAQGVYWIKDLPRQPTPPHREDRPDPVPLWDVAGVSGEWALSRARFLAPRTIRAGSAITGIRSLITEAIPSALIAPRVDDDSVPRLIEQRDRWGLISGGADAPSLAKPLGARVFCDARGVFVIAAEGTLADDLAWVIDSGDDGVQVSLSKTLSVEDMRNVVSVRGVRDDGKPGVGPVAIGDTDPNSPTWVGYGKVPMFYASPALTRTDQCLRVAEQMLARHLGLSMQLDLTSVYNPALEPGDVVGVEMPDGQVQRHLVDSLTLSLTGGTMSVQTRASMTRLVGQPVDLVPADDVEDGVGTDDEAGA